MTTRTTANRRNLRALRTVVVVLVLLAAAAVGGAAIARQRLDARTLVELDGVVLVAEAIPVGTADAGVVTDVLVTEQSEVRAGQELARVRLTANGVRAKPPTEVLRAPTAGTVSEVNVAAGGVARPGEPVVTLYEQGRLTFQARVPVEELRRLRLGMRATVTGPGLGRPVSVTLHRVVPRIETDPPTATDRLTVILVPAVADMDAVRELVPGLQFKATVDTKTAAGSTPAVNRGPG